MDSFDKMFDVLEKLGRLTGREQKAAGLIRDWRARLATARARLPGKAGAAFSMKCVTNLLAAGQGSIVNEIIAVAGGEKRGRGRQEAGALQRGGLDPG